MSASADIPWRPTQWRGIQVKPALSPGERTMYFSIVQNPGLTSKQYASRLDTTRSSICRWLTGLMKKGVARRERFRYYPAE